MKLSDLTLLYVEDDPESQERMRLLLEDEVKAFHQAYHGKDGLELFHTIDPDIVVTDINMPKMDGLTLAREIRKLDRKRPIILITALDDKEILKSAIDIGVNSFISKPIDMDKLFEKLHQIADEQKEKHHEAAEKEKLFRLAHYDTLTNIPNRFLFELTLEKALSRATRNGENVTLFLIDLDDFKLINDTFGHRAGDAVLRHVSHNLQSVIRREDTLARLGGDEFALIVEGVSDRHYMDTLAAKIVETVSKPLQYEQTLLKLSCSVGIADFPQDCQEKSELYHCADIAMYKAKHLGKGGYSFYADIL